MGSQEDPPADGVQPRETGGPEGDRTDEPAEHDGGRMRYQDPETTRARPVSVGELRAREKSTSKQRQIEKARLAAEAKRRARNGRLASVTAAVGVMGAAVGFGYWASAGKSLTAQCVQDDPDQQPVIVADSNCGGYAPTTNGFFYYGGHQYRYYYNSTGTIGSPPIGGTTVAPSDARITTRSGGVIQRGGLGARLGGGGS